MNLSARDTLVSAILEFLGPADPSTAEGVRALLEAEMDAAGDAAVQGLKERLTVDRGWAYYPPDPLARRIHHLVTDRFLQPDSQVAGLDRVAGVADRRVVLLANHLSYADANVIEVLLQRGGADTLATRLTALAGPKVFSSPQRRFSSLCFGTVKVPQSAEVSSGEAALKARGIARAAQQAIDAARDRLDAGDALVLFAEGTRSRTGEMGYLLPGAARYLEGGDTWLVPIGLEGSEHLFPVDATSVRPARVAMRIGIPMRAGVLLEQAHGNRKTLMDAVGLAIAEQLPAPYRGVYGSRREFTSAAAALDAARRTV